MPIEDCLCKYCNINSIEDELYFVCKVNFPLYANIAVIIPNFIFMDSEQQCTLLLSCFDGDNEICKLVIILLNVVLKDMAIMGANLFMFEN